MVSVSGTVTQTFSDGFYLQDKKINYTIYSSQKVNPGDLVEVIGLLGPKYKVNAKQVTSTPLWSYQFVLVRSFIAFLFLAFIFNRYWTFNREKWVFQRRKEPKKYLIRRK